MNISVNKNSPIPVFYQIQEQLRKMIEENNLKPGTQLPTERELETQLNVSRVTVRKAMRGLVAEGFCRKVTGMGMFVADKKIKTDVHNLEGTTKFFKNSGKEMETRLISQKIVSPNPKMIKYLKLADKWERLLRLKRLRLVDEEPYILETTYLPLALFPGIEDKNFNGSLYEIFYKDYGVRPNYAKGIFNVVIATEEYARLLNVQLNTAHLVKEVTVFSEDNEPIEINKSVFRSDKFKFIIDQH